MGVRIGDRGRAVTRLGPSGKVAVGDETFDARAEYGFVPAGAECVVVRGEPTGLVVRPVEPGRNPDPLPNHGEEAIRKGEAHRTTTDVAEFEEKERRAAEKAERHRIGAGAVAAGSLGALFGLGGTGIGPLSGWVPATDPLYLALLLGGGLLVGMVWSVALFFAIGRAGQWASYFRGEYRHRFAPSFVVLFLMLAGTTAGAWHGYLGHGWTVAIVTGLAWAGIGGVIGAVLRGIYDFFG